MNQSPTDGTICPHCGGANAKTATRCWLCGGQLEGLDESQNESRDEPKATAAVEPVVASEASSASGPQLLVSGAATFRLSSLMLTITALAVVLSVGVYAPGLGIVLAVIVTPAFVRTAVAGWQRRRLGVPMSTGEKMLAFLCSGLLVATIGLAGCCAFYLSCWVGFGGANIVGEGTDMRALNSLDGSLGIGVISGIVVGAALAVVMIRWLMPTDRWLRKSVRH